MVYHVLLTLIWLHGGFGISNLLFDVGARERGEDDLALEEDVM